MKKLFSILLKTIGGLAMLIVSLALIINPDKAPGIAAQQPLPELKGDPETVWLVKSNWDSLLSHCPGISKYKDDLTYEKINDMLDPLLGNMSRAEVVFKVSEEPQKIPVVYRAAGHTCGFGIGQNSTIRIQKTACASVCLDKEIEDSGPDYVSNL